jgi:glutamate racemase
LLYTGKRVPKHRFYTTGEAAQFKRLADQWLEMNVECVRHMQLID